MGLKIDLGQILLNESNCNQEAQAFKSYGLYVSIPFGKKFFLYTCLQKPLSAYVRCSFIHFLLFSLYQSIYLTTAISLSCHSQICLRMYIATIYRLQILCTNNIRHLNFQVVLFCQSFIHKTNLHTQRLTTHTHTFTQSQTYIHIYKSKLPLHSWVIELSYSCRG